MSRVWLIDGKAFNSAKWKSLIRESLADMCMFWQDLNAELIEDGSISISGFEMDEHGSISKTEDVPDTGFESAALYKTNRGALASQTLGLDEYDREILETFKISEDERYPQFEKLYAEAMAGDGTSLSASWYMLPDTAKLVYTLHLWERLQKKKIFNEVWGATLCFAWPHGKVGPLLFRANLSQQEVVRMFQQAPKHLLMDPESLQVFESLPMEVTVFRGVSSLSKFRQRGFSWTSDRDHAEWFSLANTNEGTPLILEATFSRDAILMYSDFENEIVINPTFSPLTIKQHVGDITLKNNRITELRKLLREKE